jgi:C_GCAxxG_C_C family probable redox protein
MNKTQIDEAILKFKSGSNCAQSVLSTYLPTLGIPESIAHKMGTGLGSGVGRKQYICGALNAGAIVLSTQMGNEKGDDVVRKDLTLERVRQLITKFEERFKSSQCIDIIGIDISTAEGRKKALDAGVFRDICLSCIEEVCTQLEEEL